MNRKAIWLVIGLMVASMIGLVVLQMVWIRWQFQLDNQKFNDKVYEALGEVKSKLDSDAENITLELFKKKNKFYNSEGGDVISSYLNKPSEGWSAGLRKYELSSIPNFLLKPETKLENLNLESVNLYLKQALDSRGLLLKYDYGIYSEEAKDFTSVNGNYIAMVVGNASDMESDQSQILINTNYSIELFDDLNTKVGSLKINFPSKRSFLLSSVVLPLLSSIIFTVIIAFCFIYTMYVVFRQKKVSEMKTDFINNMTHEFKTPIATISLASDSITSPSIISNEDKVKRFAGIIKQENTRMLNQVEKVLQMARIDNQEFDLRIIPVNIHDLITDAIVNAKLKVELKNGQIETNFMAKDAIVHVDQNHIANIMNNLLDNAEKYTPENPNIIVSTKNYSNGVEIAVKDNGIGMSKDAQKHVFDKFYRVHTGNRHDVKGFGLGLSYVKALIDAHGGDVFVSSELGKGSTFSLRIPFKQSDQT